MSAFHSDSVAGSADAAGRSEAQPARARRRRRFVQWAVGALLAAAVLVNAFELVGDRAVVNVLTVVFTGLAAIATLAWLVFASAYPRSTRWGIGAGAIGFVVLFFLVFRIAGVSGELVPRFALRFAAPPAAPPAAVNMAEPGVAGGHAVDLRTTTPDDFPQFLGPNRNNGIDHPVLSRDWDREPPQLVWRRPIGAGWSGFAVVNGFAVTLEQQGTDEWTSCCNVSDGALRWFHAVPALYDTVIAGAGPRSTPTIDNGLVYTLGATAHLACLEGSTGKPVWEHDLLEMFGITPADEDGSVRFGRANSPLIVGDLVIVPIGGPLEGRRVSLVAFDKHTGQKVWTGGEHNASYSSPILATLRGVPQVLTVNEDAASSHDPTTGAVLWEFPWPGKSSSDANVSQMVPVGDDRVFISKGYFRGAALFEVSCDASGAWKTPSEIWSNKQVLKTKFTNVVIVDGYVYGLSDGILECVELATGKRAWRSGRYGHGQLLRVGDLLLLLSETGEMLLLDPSPTEANHVLGRFQAIEGKTWNTIALSGPLLLVRNGEEAACYRLPVVAAD